MRRKADPERQSKEYLTWVSMKTRCNSVGDTYYHDKGIRVCKRWEKSYKAFLKDMGRAPSPEHSIDRLNSQKGYSPKNCRWATDMEQGKTRSDNTWITFRGVTMIAADWARALGIGDGLIPSRLNLGWSLERALTQPVRPHRRGQKPTRPRDINLVLEEARALTAQAKAA